MYQQTIIGSSKFNIYTVVLPLYHVMYLSTIRHEIITYFGSNVSFSHMRSEPHVGSTMTLTPRVRGGSNTPGVCYNFQLIWSPTILYIFNTHDAIKIKWL